MIRITHKGDFSKTSKFLVRALNTDPRATLQRFGSIGVEALSAATPVDSGETANSWGFYTEIRKGYYKIIWTNSNAPEGTLVAILIQYGHGTRNGGYVEGRDFINPAIRPIFDKIAEDAWEEVTRG